MITLVTLPQLGETMESGRVVGWLKQPGETVRRGETLVEIESDKTVVELPALADGRVVELLAEAGADLPVGAPLCRYEQTDATAPAGAERTASDAPATPEPERPAQLDGGDAPASPSDAAQGTRPRATPIARRLARQRGVDLEALHGSGRRGRIEAADVRQATQPVTGEALAVRRWQPPAAATGTALLLHGFGGDAQSWAALAAQLTRQGVAVIAPDLPSHGATALEAQDVAGLAAPLAALLQAAPVELVGHSMGAPAAVALARAHPARVRRLTLLAPAGLDDAIDADFVHGMASVRAPGALAHLLRRLSPRPPALSAAQLAEMAGTLAAGRLVPLADAFVHDGRQQIDIVADLATLPMPVRVIWGVQDRIIPWTQVARLPSRVAVHLIAEAGHMPHWDAPLQVAALLAG